MAEPFDLDAPLRFQGSRTDHQHFGDGGIAGHQFGHTDALNGFAEPHVISQNRPAGPDGKRNAVQLIGKQFGLQQGLAQRICFDQRRATGVEISRGGKTEVITARREVVLAASSINSPKLLMLSGIGPAAHLAEHGIDVVADSPGVGRNLQDHLEIYLQMASRQPITLYKHWNLFSKALIGAQWLFAKTGLGASAPAGGTARRMLKTAVPASSGRLARE
mgnify:CR=1 FL=1